MTFIRLTRFSINPPASYELIRETVDALNQKSKELNGFQEIKYFADMTTGNYGAISYFAAKEDRQVGGFEFAKIVKEHLGHLLNEAPNTTEYEE